MRELWYAFVRWCEKPSRKMRLLNALEDIAVSQAEIAINLQQLANYEGRRNTREQTMYQAWQEMQEPEQVPAIAQTVTQHVDWSYNNGTYYDGPVPTVEVTTGIAGGGNGNF
jgi:hypothetical protein